jgi:glyoxylase-like metal-dependent hydrolase (beta-lactamase superfamily II)
MNARFEPISDRLYRLRVPFEDLYTSVFLIHRAEGDLLADTATTQRDVEQYILPALYAGGFSPTDIFVSHNHGDHAGGLPYLAAALPMVTLHMVEPAGLSLSLAARTRRIKEGDSLGTGIAVWQMPGHTAEMAGLYDTESGTLLSFDGLQLYGVGRYGTIVSDMPAYLATLARVARSGVKRIVAAHAYVGGGAVAEGDAAVQAYLTACRAALDDIAAFALRSDDLDPAALAAAWRQARSLPPVPPETFLAWRKMH